MIRFLEVTPMGKTQKQLMNVACIRGIYPFGEAMCTLDIVNEEGEWLLHIEESYANTKANLAGHIIEIVPK